MKSEPCLEGQDSSSKTVSTTPRAQGPNGQMVLMQMQPPLPGFGSGWMLGWLWRPGWRSQVCRPPGKSEIPVCEVPFPQGDACCPDVGHLTCRQGQASLKGFPLLEPTPQSPSLCGSRMCTFSHTHTHTSAQASSHPCTERPRIRHIHMHVQNPPQTSEHAKACGRTSPAHTRHSPAGIFVDRCTMNTRAHRDARVCTYHRNQALEWHQ